MKLKRNKIIQTAIDALGAKTYLEIGTRSGRRTLIPIKVERKIAVDVKFQVSWKDRIRSWWNTSYYEMPSDEYFRKYNDNFDVAFIDGLHTFEQSLRDVFNSLVRLNPRGIIILHDANPQKEETASPVFREGSWCGEVWKTVLTLRGRDDLNVFVLDCDMGLGIVTKGKPENILGFRYEDIKDMTYQDLEQNREKFLNLKPPEYWFEFLKSYKE